jgi:hypothetical protein
MSKREQYKKAHHIAKGIVCAVVIFLLILSRSYDTVVFDALAVIVWLFGVNPVAYVIESILHYKHNHSKL